MNLWIYLLTFFWIITIILILINILMAHIFGVIYSLSWSLRKYFWKNLEDSWIFIFMVIINYLFLFIFIGSLPMILSIFKYYL